MRRTSRSVLVTLMAGMLLPLVPLPAVAARPSTPAAYSRAAMSRDELGILPEALGRVTKAGKVAGTIDAAVGDIVLPANAAAPDGYAGPALNAGRAPTGTAAATVATVLHAEVLNVASLGYVGPGGQEARIRWLHAMQENTDREARGYYRARLVYGDASDITWATYHQLHFFRVHRGDEDNSERDGCAATPGAHCTWTKDPPDCRGPNPPCDVYLVVGTYRPKGNSPDIWLPEVYDYKYWLPSRDEWRFIRQCPGGSPPGVWLQGLWWHVGTNGTSVPEYCPYPEGV